MKALKTPIFSFVIVNLVKKGILHFLINNGLSTDCSAKECIHTFGSLLKNAKCINFQFHIFNLVKKDISDFQLLQPLIYV